VDFSGYWQRHEMKEAANRGGLLSQQHIRCGPKATRDSGADCDRLQYDFQPFPTRHSGPLTATQCGSICEAAQLTIA